MAQHFELEKDEEIIGVQKQFTTDLFRNRSLVLTNKRVIYIENISVHSSSAKTINLENIDSIEYYEYGREWGKMLVFLLVGIWLTLQYRSWGDHWYYWVGLVTVWIGFIMVSMKSKKMNINSGRITIEVESMPFGFNTFQEVANEIERIKQARLDQLALSNKNEEFSANSLDAQLDQIEELKAKGRITEEEYKLMRQRILGLTG